MVNDHWLMVIGNCPRVTSQSILSWWIRCQNDPNPKSPLAPLFQRGVFKVSLCKREI
jgi:hypothetical protein